MSTLLMLIPAVAVLAAAAYAQYRLPFHTGSPRGLWASRLLLVFTGVAFGVVSARYPVPGTGLERVLGFLTGFGVVHVPAAAILFLKRQRALGR